MHIVLRKLTIFQFYINMMYMYYHIQLSTCINYKPEKLYNKKDLELSFFLYFSYYQHIEIEYMFGF